MRSRSLVLVGVLLVVVSLAWAGGDKVKQSPAEKAAKLQAQLGLTDAQAEQVAALIEEVHGRWAEVKASELDKAAREEAKKKLKAEFYAGIRSILSDQQLARYEQMEAEHSHRKH